MKLRVYIETSVISYLTARPSNHIIAAGQQAMTREWWDGRRHDFDLFISELVNEEASRGDRQAAAVRLAALDGFPKLPIMPEVVALTKAIMKTGKMPTKASDDAAHVAIAAVHRMNFLLTWNCKHIANAEIRGHVEKCCRKNGYAPPAICTPYDLSKE